jgi:protein gp37
MDRRQLDADPRAQQVATGRVGWHCEHASEGCRNCYAEGMNARLGTRLAFKPGHRKDLQIFVDERSCSSRCAGAGRARSSSVR